MNPRLDALLEETERAMASNPGLPSHVDRPLSGEDAPGAEKGSSVHVGVDLGTAYTVLIVLDEQYRPIAGTYRFAQVVRDGLVVDFIGAIDLIKELKNEIETRLGRTLRHAATGYPPGVPAPRFEQRRMSCGPQALIVRMRWTSQLPRTPCCKFATAR